MFYEGYWLAGQLHDKLVQRLPMLGKGGVRSGYKGLVLGPQVSSGGYWRDGVGTVTVPWTWFVDNGWFIQSRFGRASYTKWAFHSHGECLNKALDLLVDQLVDVYVKSRLETIRALKGGARG